MFNKDKGCAVPKFCKLCGKPLNFTSDIDKFDVCTGEPKYVNWARCPTPDETVGYRPPLVHHSVFYTDKDGKWHDLYEWG